MSNYVLFSPVSTSDPVKFNRDGAFLHILRFYQPSKAYVFMTKEMLELHEKDNRFIEIAKRVCSECKFEVLKHEEIEKAHEFLIYDKLFENYLNKIKNDNPNCKILVNVSSGTPQMTASLYLLSATLPFEVKPIQVSTPEDGANHKKREFDIEKEWELLEDNKNDISTIENRNKPVIPENVTKKILTQNIISHINKYNYFTAIQLVDTAKDLYPKEFYLLLEAAVKRTNLEIARCKEKLKETSVAEKDFFPILNDNETEIFEYILYLKRKFDKKEPADFVRGISPVISDLFEKYLEKVNGISITDFAEKDDKGVLKYVENRMPSTLFNDLNKNPNIKFDFSRPVAASNLILIIKSYNSNNPYNKDLQKMNELRYFERDIRNIAAHEIIGLSEAVVKKKTGKDVGDILYNIKELYSTIFNLKDPNHWKSYDAMNNLLINKLNANEDIKEN